MQFHRERIDFNIYFQDATNWRFVFFICAAIYLFGMIVFIIFGSTDLEPWVYRLNESSISEKDLSSSKLLWTYRIETLFFYLRRNWGNECSNKHLLIAQ